jgi:hypothetical protein
VVEMKAEGRNIWGRDGRIISKVMPETEGQGCDQDTEEEVGYGGLGCIRTFLCVEQVVIAV